MLGIEVVSSASILGIVATRPMTCVTQPPKGELLFERVIANLYRFSATMTMFLASRAAGEVFRGHSAHLETVRIAGMQCPSGRASHQLVMASAAFLVEGPARGQFLQLLRMGNSLVVLNRYHMYSQSRTHCGSQSISTWGCLVVRD